MLSIERVKQILNDPSLTEEEMELVRNEARAWAELAFQEWIEKRTAAKNQMNKNNEQPDVPDTS